eukprot:TRINITY_DN25330_c0_g1_i1.p1 TRINITY_DN25330_c0_g1~~TRINITY_DN25330_c0_g1_i1.p1  ORF type:complete len:298 (+),score=37.91 TRINITY_DN25330_c0_g1_i1:56-949(+)
MEHHEVALHVATSALAPALAAFITNPADVAKTRLNMDCELLPPTAQRRYHGVVDCWRSIARAEGLLGLQRGLSLVVAREALKNAFRLGLYEPAVAMLMMHRNLTPAAPPPMYMRVLAGGLTGALSALICNPLDLLKTRAQLGGDGAVVAARRLVASEGMLALWRRGVKANAARSALATGTALPTNALLKDRAGAVPGLAARPAARDLLAGVGSSACTVAVINPVDLIRTRLYSQPPPAAGAPSRYRGAMDCAARVCATEGILALWKGAGAAFLRIGPHQTLTFVFIGAMRRAWVSAG